MAPNSVRSVDVAGGNSAAVATSTKNANTIAELIQTVPMTWRSACSAHLTTVYRAATKLCTVQNTIAQYERHTAEGSFPNAIRNCLKDPHVQFSKEFLGTESGTLVKGIFDAEILQCRKSLLRCALKQKREELVALQALIRFDETAWRSVVAETANRVATALGISITGNVGATPPAWTQEEVARQAKADCDMLWLQGSVFHFRAIAIARSIADRTLVQKARQLTLKQDTDVAMRDADVDRSTRDVVRDEMQAQLRLLKQDLAKTIGQARKPAGPSRKKQSGGSNKPRVNKRKTGKQSSRKTRK